MRKLTKSDWQGTAQLSLGWGLFRGEAGDNRAHRHQAMQVMLSPVPQEIWLQDQGWSKQYGIILGANHQHQFGSTDGAVTLIYVDPASRPGKQLGAALKDGRRILGKVESDKALDHLQAQTDTSDLFKLLEPLLPGSCTHSSSGEDALINGLLARLPAHPGESFSTKDFYRWSGLSSSRLQHRFRQHTGLPIRAYLLWWRLLLALEAISHGADLSEASLDAGFADAAHCTRTFRRYFGVAPSNLRGIRFITHH